jgi:uncharacterized RDD family membrane protein YckC
MNNLRRLLMQGKAIRRFDAHETGRMLELHGMELASFRSRAAAFALDFLLAAAAFTGLVMLGSWLAGLAGIKLGDVHLTFDFTHWYSLVFLVVYFTLLMYFTNGRSLGKWLFGVRVISLAHDHMTLWHSFERSLGYGASFLEFGFGFFQYFIHPNRCTVHDRIAETIVIADRKKNEIQPLTVERAARPL